MNKEYEYLETCPSCNGSGVAISAVKRYNREYEKYNKKLFDLSTSNDSNSFVKHTELLCNPPIYPDTNCKICDGTGKVTRKTSFIQLLVDIKNCLINLEKKL